MKFSIIGYGKMGKEVAQIAQSKAHTLIDIFDIDNISQLTIQNLQKADLVFEFTNPHSAYKNVKLCLEASVACVCGTTGWNQQLEELKKITIEQNKTLFWSPNFSIGMNILFHLNKQLAKIMNNFDYYDVQIAETHHIHKLDAPSGTAVSLANQIISNLDRKKGWQLNKQQEEQIKITAIRQGEVFGDHSVVYDSIFDTIEIRHSAKNRKGLANGAVLAAEFVLNKKGFFTMENLLNF